MAQSALPSSENLDQDTASTLIYDETQNIINAELETKSAESAVTAAVSEASASVETQAAIVSLSTNIIYGTEGNDRLSGTFEDDVIYDYGGNDLVIGGVGNDTLIGGDGDDTYIYKTSGFGQDVIQNFDTDMSSIDAITFIEIRPADVAVNRENNDLVLSIRGSGDTITISRYFESDDYKVDEVRFEYSTTVWSLDDIVTQTLTFNAINGTDGNDTLRGTTADDTIYGYNGNDTLYAGSGNDMLIGGEGNDTLVGGEDINIYYFSSGFGQDVIDNTAKDLEWGSQYDEIRFSADIDPSKVWYDLAGQDLIIRIHGSDDSVTVKDYFTQSLGSQKLINKIIFEQNGSMVTYSDIVAAMTTGTPGDDVLHGDLIGGQSHLFGGEGNDVLHAYTGSNMLVGGAGNDTLIGGAGNDILVGDEGNDIYYYAAAGFGQDVIDNYDTGTDKTDTVVFGAIGPEEIEVSRENDDLILSVKGTDDTITISRYFESDDYKIDEVRFETDGTVWSGDEIADQIRILNTIYGTDRRDTLRGTAEDDVIYGYGGNDTLYGEAGDDTLNGGTGNDTLIGGEGNNTYYFSRGFGQDVIDNSDKEVWGLSFQYDTVRFAADIDPAEVHFDRDGMDLIINVKASGDSVTVTDYFTWNYIGGETGLIDQIVFEQDGSTLTSREIHETMMTGTSGDDILYGAMGGLFGGHSYVNGYGGNDILYAYDATAVMNGGTGNDTLIGGDTGKVQYLFMAYDTYLAQDGEVGFGQDVIQHYNPHPEVAWEGWLRYSSEVIINSLYDENGGWTSAAVTRTGNDLFIEVDGTGESVTVQNYFLSAHYKIEHFSINGVDLSSTEVDDYLSQASTILIGGDIGPLIGGAGSDVLITSGQEYLDGGAGNDILVGGWYEDVLIGGTGNDTLKGAQGSDTYYYEASGFGKDIIDNYDTSTNKTDVILFGAIRPDEIEVTRLLNDLVLSVKSTGDSITVNGYFEDNACKVDEVRFESDGTVWAGDEIVSQIKPLNAVYGTERSETVRGTSADDMVYGFYGNDTLYGGAGNDFLYGGEGNDTLRGEAGHDTLYGEQGNDTLYGAAGNDVLYGGDGDDRLEGDAGDDVLYGEDGDDRLEGGAGDDVLEGSWGNDTLTGGAGNDTYVFYMGSGQDIINNSSGNTSTDTIRFENMTSDMLTGLYKSGSHLILTYGQEDQITIQNHFSSSSYRIDQITFSGDDVTWTMAGLYAHYELQLTSGNDTYTFTEAGLTVRGGDGNDRLTAASSGSVLYGDAGNDTLNGAAGNDVLYGGEGVDSLTGGSGNDFLDGGSENDTLNGGTGSDTYVFRYGSGQDVINNYDSSSASVDTVRFEDVYSEGLTGLYKSGNHLILTYSEEDQITIQNHFLGSSYRVDQFAFVDDVTWTMTDLYAHYELQLTSGSDTYTASEAGITVRGGDGNDRLTAASSGSVLYGDAGNDTLYSGSGSDTLSGGAGNDTFYLASGGKDTLLYELLASGDATGGSGKDTVNGFTLGNFDTASNADRIDLRDLLNLNAQSDFNDMGDLENYLSVEVSGRNSTLKVDLDGTGNSFQMTEFLTLNGVSTSLNQLLENNQLSVI